VYRTCAATIALLLITALPAAALVHSGRSGETAFSVYAPDWTWQKGDINILVVFENPAPGPVRHTVELVLPEAFRDHFGHAGAAPIPAAALTRTVDVPAGATARTALTKITALDGVALQRYPLMLRVTREGEARAEEVPYALQTVRGAAVNPGQWALYVPAGVALAFCIAFALMFRRFAAPGAWKRPSEPIVCPENQPGWVEQEP